jgi:pyruvate ferredoxin oxidoreductase delta subunit
VLGALAGLDSSLISMEVLEPYLAARSGGEQRVAAARQASEAIVGRTRVVTPDEGIAWTHTVPTLPKWFSFTEGAAVPAVPRGFVQGPGGQSRNTSFKRGTTKTQRPVVRFDLCTKCTLCWLECPDECFDPTSDGLYDIAYEYCVGCGKCAEVCPVQECIVMVDELRFTDYASPWEHWQRDESGYIEWAEEKKGTERVSYPFVTGTGREVEVAERVPTGKVIPVKKGLRR